MTTAILSATALSAAIHSRRVSCRQVMRDHLDRIERLNPAINAIVSLRDADALLAEAAEADRVLASGTSRGVLHGFPFAVKDLSEAAGIRCTYGSRIHADHVPDFDDIHVARIRAAGAILIGKTNAPEMGLGSQTYNDVFGATRNPWDLTKCAGGSSGGAAAALAARLVPLADGSDMMGSLRNPAAFNNVIGFRPSLGAVPSLSAELFLSSFSVNGPMARTVADLALLFGVQSGRDPRDPWSVTPGEGLPASDRRLRVGWLGDYGGHLPFEPGVLELCRAGLAVFERLGMAVEPVDIGFDMDRLWWCWTRLRSWLVANRQAAAHADPARRSLMKPELVWEIETGQRVSAAELYEASTVRSDWYRRMLALFDRFDALILPAAQVFPFDVETHWPATVAGRAMDTYHRWMEVVIGPTLAGLPSVVVPAGFNGQGLPTGFQIVGAPRADRAVLEIAARYEQAVDWLERSPPRSAG